MPSVMGSCPPATAITRADPRYPWGLGDRLGAGAPEVVTVIGDPALLSVGATGLFTSSRLPADLVIPTLELARGWRDAGVAVASGFHAPVERECLELLLTGSQPVLAWLARGVEGMRLDRAWRVAVEQGRLLVASGYGAKLNRATVRSAEGRNRMVAAAAHDVFVAGATPGGRLHGLAREVLARRQPLSCFDHPSNHDLFLLGATGLPLE